MSQTTTDRRSFLKLAGLGAAGTAAALTGAPAGAAASGAAGPSDGYSETDHVRKFYELARF